MLMLVPKYRAVLLQPGENIVSKWMDTREQAVMNAREHLDKGDYLGYKIDEAWMRE